jgi:hypothetical protein
MDDYLVFLSSPSDVRIERDRAEQVINLMNSERPDQSQSASPNTLKGSAPGSAVD